MTKVTLPHMTRHFSMTELIITNTGLENFPPLEIRNRLRLLAQYLETVRERCEGTPLIVHSGYRSKAVNAKIGGSPTSAHLLGWAADISCNSMTASSLAERIKMLGGFDQLIFEPTRGIVHVSIDPRMRGEVLTMLTEGGKRYVKGIDHFWYTRRLRANDN